MLKIGSIFVDFTQIIWPPEEVIKKITISFNSCYYCYTKFWKLKLAHNERHSVDGQRKDKNRSLEWQRRSFKIILYFNLQARSMGGGGQLRIKNCGEIIEINTKLTLKFSIRSNHPPPSRIRILKILLIRIGGGGCFVMTSDKAKTMLRAWLGVWVGYG